jgi:hypothetical protein|tara:strand:- start:49 stop:231 length:183 start_codon:yes stop_codon:yes gene_type:complete
MQLTYNELLLLRGALYTKRMYKGMTNIPLGGVVWEDWMEESVKKVDEELKNKYPDAPDWK